MMAKPSTVVALRPDVSLIDSLGARVPDSRGTLDFEPLSDDAEQAGLLRALLLYREYAAAAPTAPRMKIALDAAIAAFKIDREVMSQQVRYPAAVRVRHLVIACISQVCPAGNRMARFLRMDRGSVVYAVKKARPAMDRALVELEGVDGH